MRSQSRRARRKSASASYWAKAGILRNVLVRGMIPVLIGLAAGAAAVFATKAMAGLLFAIRPDDPLTFAGIAALLLAVALIGCVIPARRAVRVDPMKALRTE